MKNLVPELRDVALTLYVTLNTPRSLSCFILMKAGEWDQLVSLTTDPRNYLEGPWGANSYRRDVQATDLLRKSPEVPASFKRQEAALQNFHLCENECLNINGYLDLISSYPFHASSAYERRLYGILRKARKIADRILGPVPDDLQGRFGPGTSFELRGQSYSTMADKLWTCPLATPAAGPIFRHLYQGTLWGRTRAELGLNFMGECRGDRFTTVPKTAKTDRGIAIQPLGNLFCQLGIGSYMKERLARVGLEVAPCRPARLQNGLPLHRGPSKDGQTIHRRLAREGSLTGRWATIDLTNASDTVSYQIVKQVLPTKWFDLLCSMRTPFTQVSGSWHKLQKFSAMGNGYTFELETLIFSCLIEATTGSVPGSDLYVYGDDIIVPVEAYRDSIAILQACGFTPNRAKTFSSGPFRESCGGDYFSGYDVRPVQIDGALDSPVKWMALHNLLRAKWPQATDTLKRIRRCVPNDLRVFGPPRLGDVVFHHDDERKWGTWIKDGIKWLLTIHPQPLRIPLDRWGTEFTLCLAVLGCSSQGISPRGEVLGYLKKRASVS